MAAEEIFIRKMKFMRFTFFLLSYLPSTAYQKSERKNSLFISRQKGNLKTDNV